MATRLVHPTLQVLFTFLFAIATVGIMKFLGTSRTWTTITRLCSRGTKLSRPRRKGENETVRDVSVSVESRDEKERTNPRLLPVDHPIQEHDVFFRKHAPGSNFTSLSFKQLQAAGRFHAV